MSQHSTQSIGENLPNKLSATPSIAVIYSRLFKNKIRQKAEKTLKTYLSTHGANDLFFVSTIWIHLWSLSFLHASSTEVQGGTSFRIGP